MLNGTPVSAQRTFTNTGSVLDGLYFGAFADVTNIVKTTGNGTYLFSDFDAVITDCYYITNGYYLNYSGWAIVVVYEDPTLSGRMVNIYDGLTLLSYASQSVSIDLDRLNMTDTAGAKLGLLAWEGDDFEKGEELRVNDNVISNLPLNPADDIFNSTNSYTGSTT